MSSWADVAKARKDDPVIDRTKLADGIESKEGGKPRKSKRRSEERRADNKHRIPKRQRGDDNINNDYLSEEPGIYVRNEQTDVIIDHSCRLNGLLHVKRRVNNIFDCIYPKSGRVEDYGGFTCSACKSGAVYKNYRYEPNSMGMWVYNGKLYCEKDMCNMLDSIFCEQSGVSSIINDKATDDLGEGVDLGKGEKAKTL